MQCSPYWPGHSHLHVYSSTLRVCLWLARPGAHVGPAPDTCRTIQGPPRVLYVYMGFHPLRPPSQGMTELGRDVAVLAHTAVHSLHHALVEDLPAVSGRHQRRHRLQLLHRPAGAAAAAGHQALLQQQQQLRQLQPGQGGQEAEEQLSPPSCGGTELKVLATPRQPQPQHVLAEEGGPVPKALWPDGADAAAEAVGPEADGAAAVPVDAGAPLPGSSGAEDAPVLLSDTMFDQLDAQTAEMRSAPLTGRTPKQLLAAPAAEAAAERTACTAAACATSRPVDGDGVPAIAGPDANMPAQPRCTGEDGVRAEATAAAEANRPPGEAVPGPAAEPPAASVAQRRAPAPQDALSAEADTSAGLATTSAAAALPPMPASSVTPGAAEGTGDSAAKAGSGAGGTGPSSACGSCPATATPSALSTPAKSARSSRMATPSKHAQQAALCAASATTAAAGDRPGLAHAALASGGGVLRVKSAAFRKVSSEDGWDGGRNGRRGHARGASVHGERERCGLGGSMYCARECSLLPSPRRLESTSCQSLCCIVLAFLLPPRPRPSSCHAHLMPSLLAQSPVWCHPPLAHWCHPASSAGPCPGAGAARHAVGRQRAGGVRPAPHRPQLGAAAGAGRLPRPRRGRHHH